MKKLLLPLATSLLLSAPLAFAASTTELIVKGLITPSACDIALSSGGIIDHGKISSSDLNQSSQTIIGNDTLSLSVNCDAAIAFALKAIDNQAGSSISNADFGLGLINSDQKLGHYKVTLRNPIADNVAVQTIASSDLGVTWYKEKLMGPGLYMSVGAVDDDTQPLPTQELMLDLEVETIISRADGLGLDDEVLIDGSATIEVMYL